MTKWLLNQSIDGLCKEENMDRELFEMINQNLDRIMKDSSIYAKAYRLDRTKAEEELTHINYMREKAIGDKIARDFIIAQYTKFLNTEDFGLNDESLERLIKLEPLENEVYIIYEMLLEIYGIKELILRYQLPHKIEAKHILEIAKKEKSILQGYFIDRINVLKLLARLLYSENYGHSVIDSLQYQDISEIGVLNEKYVYIAIGSDKYYLTFLQFPDKNTIINIQKKTTVLGVENFDENNTTLTTAKQNGSRITVAGFNTTEGGQPYYNERIFNLSKIDLATMRDELKTIDHALYEFIRLHMKGKGTFLVTGPDMGVGKSTFMLSMINEIPQRFGIGIIDPPNEMKAHEKYPEKNIATLIPSEKLSIGKTFQHMLKMARDYVMVSEITDSEEMGELMNVFLRLNAGGGATMHNLSPYEVVPNVRNLLMNTNMYHDRDSAEQDIARALNMIFHLRRLNPERIVLDSVVELIPTEFELFNNVQPLLEGNYRSRLSQLVNLLQIKTYRSIVNKNYRYSTIFKYNQELDCWDIKNMPSDRYFQNMAVNVGCSEIKALKRVLRGEVKC